MHVVGAVNHPLDFVWDELEKIDPNTHWFVHCAGGYRSMIMSSILVSNGFKNIINIKGGFEAIKETNIPLTEFKEQVTML
jgi:hydroxyacylglutathione hydrolase